MKRSVKILAFVLILDLLLAFFCINTWILFPAAKGLEVADEATAKPGEGKFLALTFDDGPHSQYTKKLLEGLKTRNVKASFFLVGKSIPGNEEVIRQMAKDGHLIGTHCYKHEDLTKKNTEEACADIIKTNELIEEITGKWPEYIRPPYGIWNDELETCVNMTPVFWNIDTLDWKYQNKDRIVNHIEKNAGKHQIILLHDVFETSVDAALTAIDTLTKQGYTFVTVDELLID